MWPSPQFLRIWSHLLKKSLMENFIFCAVFRTLSNIHDGTILSKPSIKDTWKSSKTALNKKSTSRSELISGNWKPFKNNEKHCFMFLFLRCLNFCSDFFSLAGKRLEKKAKVNFKICDFINFETKNFNTHIAQYLKTYRQSDNESLSVDRI